jgi:hypothetical protein
LDEVTLKEPPTFPEPPDQFNPESLPALPIANVELEA